jgi:transcription elongation factor GreA
MLRRSPSSHGEDQEQEERATVKYTLVSEEEADLKVGKISIQSPIGKGLLGKKVGQVALVIAPGGQMEFEVVEISR